MNILFLTSVTNLLLSNNKYTYRICIKILVKLLFDFFYVAMDTIDIMIDDLFTF